MGEHLSKDLEIKYPNLLKDNINEIISSKGLIDFHNYTRCKETYLKISPCNNCEFTCRACPLLYHDNNEVLECFYARNELAKLDEEEIMKHYNKSKDIRLLSIKDKVIISDFITQNKYVLEGIANEAWDLIDEKNSIKDIIHQIYNNYKQNVSYEDIQRDILDLIYDLKANELIKKSR